MSKTCFSADSSKRTVPFVIAFALVLVFSSIPVFSQTATIESIAGRVEIRPLNGDWVPAAVGAVVAGGDTISTGFGSSATMNVGSSTVTVTPLTRLTLEELIQRGDTQETRLFLQVGKVQADVRTAEGLSHDFQLRSASTTASVRGTSFEFDGISVRGFTGEVQVSNLAGHGRRVIRGERVTAEGVSAPVPAEQERERQAEVRRQPATEQLEGPTASGSSSADVPVRIEPAEVVEVLSETLDITIGTIDVSVTWEQP